MRRANSKKFALGWLHCAASLDASAASADARRALKVEVLNTGTELLLGNVLNKHLRYFAEQLFPLGLRIQRQTTVPDGAAIRDALIEAFPRCELLLVTGGLGPTTDDLTREITAELLGLRLLEHPEVLKAILARCERRGIPMRERMRRQAMAPETATILPNANGTAPGLYLQPITTPSSATPHVFLLPGPPRELHPMFEEHALPIIRRIAPPNGDREIRIYRVIGMGESAVEEVIGLELDALPVLEVGYCARPNEVDLRLVGSPDLLDSLDSRVRAALGANLAAIGDIPLEKVVVDGLRERGLRLAVAESCTGGLLANRITNIPGASEVFLEGIVSYANQAKTNLLGVPAELIEREGAVSAAVAARMAEGMLARSGADLAAATTGLAGPDGDGSATPIGTVFIAVATRGTETHTTEHHFPLDRETFKQVATQAALDCLRRASANG